MADYLKDPESVEIVMNTRERQISEQIAVGSTYTDTLKCLGMPLNTLPQKCRNLLHKAAEHQISMEIPSLDPVLFSLQQTSSALKQMDDDYEILLLRQKEKELDYCIEKNKEEIKAWKDELALARDDLKKQDPSPENINDEIRVIRQKIASYEQSCEKTKMRFSSLKVPTELYPSHLESLVAKLETLRGEAAELQSKADHILLAKAARDNIMQIRANKS